MKRRSDPGRTGAVPAEIAPPGGEARPRSPHTPGAPRRPRRRTLAIAGAALVAAAPVATATPSVDADATVAPRGPSGAPGRWLLLGGDH